MRSFALALLVATSLPCKSQAQQTIVTINFVFEGTPTPQTADRAEVQNVLAARSVIRAWTDSVDVFLDQLALGAQSQGWRRSHNGEPSNYSVMIVGLPVRGGICRALGLTTYSMVVFEPATGDQWKFVQNFVGYETSAERAAGAIFTAATQAINAARTAGPAR